MTVDALFRDSVAFQQALDAVTSELVTVQMDGAAAFIKTPLTYPGGSSVVVRVSEDQQGYFVTDYGLGIEEAELMGVYAAAFAKHAHQVANATGTRFDNHSFFALEASREQLCGAIVAIANASQVTVIHSCFGVADKTGQAEAQLYARLQSIFGPRRARIDRRATVNGYSNTPWKVNALVSIGKRRTVFEAVSKHHTSITAATTKFYDIARIGDHAPQRVAIVRSKKDLGTYLGVLSQAASVLEDSAPNDAIIKLVEAA